MMNPLFSRGVAPTTFRGLAGRVIDRHFSGAPYAEWMLQEALQQLLERNHWQECRVVAKRPRCGDLSLMLERDARPYFVVELKRDARLNPRHDMQGRNYAASHTCPCVVTNGVQYKLIRAQDRCLGAVTLGQQAIVELGEFQVSRPAGALERRLDGLFFSAAEGAEAVSRTAHRIVASELRKGAALPSATLPARGLLAGRW